MCAYEDSDQPGHPPSLIRVFAVRMKKTWVLIYPLSAQQRLWSDWAVARRRVILLVLSWGGLLTVFTVLSSYLHTEDFNFGDSYTIGSSKKRFQINTWEGMLGKARFSMAVTADQNCYPVADQLYGSDSNGEYMHIFKFLWINIHKHRYHLC